MFMMGMNGARVERWSLIACMNTRSESVDNPSNGTAPSLKKAV
jgi:hypothetical protein